MNGTISNLKASKQQQKPLTNQKVANQMGEDIYKQHL